MRDKICDMDRQPTLGILILLGCATAGAKYRGDGVPQVAALFFVFAGIALAFCIGHWRRAAPTPPGLCKACGYDLRATPDRCPECGTVPGKASWDTGPRAR